MGLEQEIRVSDLLGQAEQLLPCSRASCALPEGYTRTTPPTALGTAQGSPTCSHSSRARAYNIFTSGPLPLGGHQRWAEVICTTSSCLLRSGVFGRASSSATAVLNRRTASAYADRSTACCPAR